MIRASELHFVSGAERAVLAADERGLFNAKVVGAPLAFARDDDPQTRNGIFT